MSLSVQTSKDCIILVNASANSLGSVLLKGRNVVAYVFVQLKFVAESTQPLIQNY